MSMRSLLVLCILAGSACNDAQPALRTSTARDERVIRVTAKRYEYSPSRIVLKKGEPVTLELISLDHRHGFDVPELGMRTDIEPGKVAQLRLVPERVGVFGFHCDVFCGSGHEDMSGEIVVEE